MKMEQEILRVVQEMDKNLNKRLDQQYMEINQLFGEQEKRIIKRFDEQEERINQRFDEQEERLNKRLDEQDKKIELQGETLKEHTRLLSALISGQESLKAELSEMRLQNAKEFGEVKERIDKAEVNVEILKEDNWANKVDIRRVQKTMGMIS